MSDFNILTPGEKIRKIRDEFGFKQEDITGGEVTRNLISIIENNKANLTEASAKVLVEGINNLCKEKGIDFSVKEDYLLESVTSQAKKVADDYMAYIKGIERGEIINITDKLNEIDVFLKKYNVDEKRPILYRIIAKRFAEIKLYSRAMDYYIKAYESSVDVKITTYTLIGIGSCCSYLAKYSEAINYYKLLLDLNKDTQFTYIAKFNIALCNKKLKNFDDSLNMLYGLKECFSTTPPTLINESDVDSLIGICLFNLKSFNKAITTFKGLLKDSNSEIDEMLTLTNLADVYQELKDFSNLNRICNKIKKKIENNTDFMNSYEGDIYISLAKNLKFIGDIETSKQLLLKSLECFKNGASEMYIEDIEKVFCNLIDIYITNSDSTNIEYLRNEFFELVEKELIPKANLISLKFIKYYNYTRELDKVDNIVEFLVG